MKARKITRAKCMVEMRAKMGKRVKSTKNEVRLAEKKRFERRSRSNMHAVAGFC